MLRLTQETCGELAVAGTREWLETNGLGGYASQTIVGMNTRRYHGLLVAATRPPVGRVVMLANMAETFVIDGRRYELSTNQYPGTIHPRGHQLQTEFRQDPFPVFTYRAESLILEKSLFMPHGENTLVLQYELKLDEAETAHRPLPTAHCFLELRPLVAFRDYHHLGHEGDGRNFIAQAQEALAMVCVEGDGLRLYLAHDADGVEMEGYWYRSFEYERERERGFDYTEDLFNPFALKFKFGSRTRARLIASTEKHEPGWCDEARERELRRRGAIAQSAPRDDEFTRALCVAADQFICTRGAGQTVIAGYPWFSDWGRDTMIALPGLTLVTGRTEVAKSILLEYARHASEGMLPNRFPDAGDEPEYNTVDATLWFFEAVAALLRYTHDRGFVRAELYETLADIIEWHVRGTRYGIRVEACGLLAAGAAGAQLTWMDAKVGDWVVTPRTGFAVEIQALWYNALGVMEGLAKEFGDDARREFYASLALKARESFNLKFWNDEAACLFDVIDGETRDGSIRPNQVFAISLPHSMLSEERARLVVLRVRRDLLTPYGLRSLAPHDPLYRGRYAGDPLSRDGAYHQGTVWAWLMGPFITAYLKVSGRSPEAKEQARRWLLPFQKHLGQAGLGQVSEVFDGDAPHAPGGCIAQAWSVGEILRAAFEDVYTP